MSTPSLTPNMDAVKHDFEGLPKAKDAIGRITMKTVGALTEAIAYENDIGSPNMEVNSGYFNAASAVLASACMTLADGNPSLAKKLIQKCSVDAMQLVVFGKPVRTSQQETPTVKQ